MVHLSSVANDAVAQKPLVEGLEKVKFQEDEDQTLSVYGSRYAAQELPAHEMPEEQMPKEVAYRMIKDDLSLDGNPMLNLASFVTTYMVLIEIDLGTIEADTVTGRRSREANGRGLAKELHRL